MNVTEELKQLLLDSGAKLVGVGDMSGVAGCDYPVGVSVAIPLPKDLVEQLKTAPTEEYYHMYYALNKKLNEIVSAGEEFLKSKGYNAYAQTTDRVKTNENRISKLPHKTVATRAGLGWIGKNCLLVTKEYGPAIRISSLLTDAPLKCNEPINESKCGGCSLCVKNCPGQALKGTLWTAGMERSEIVDVEQCFKTQFEIMKKNTGIETDLCGKCFAVCAHTQRYLRQ